MKSTSAAEGVSCFIAGSPWLLLIIVLYVPVYSGFLWNVDQHSTMQESARNSWIATEKRSYFKGSARFFRQLSLSKFPLYFYNTY